VEGKGKMVWASVAWLRLLLQPAAAVRVLVVLPVPVVQVLATSGAGIQRS
jgi:hypothetical protein